MPDWFVTLGDITLSIIMVGFIGMVIASYVIAYEEIKERKRK